MEQILGDFVAGTCSVNDIDDSEYNTLCRICGPVTAPPPHQRLGSMGKRDDEDRNQGMAKKKFQTTA